MMDQLENELRAGLKALAEDGEGPVDVEAAISAGEALRRGRWARGLAGGVAIAVVVGAVLVWPALSGRPIPAVPDPVTSPTPSPTASTSGEVSAELSYPGGRVVVFRDEARGVWGYHDYANDTHKTEPLDTLPVGSVLGLSATSEGEYFLDSTAIGLLPPGGTDPVFVFTQDDITWTSATLGDTGQVVFLVKADRIRQGAPMVDSITYTDQAGQRISYDPHPEPLPSPAPTPPEGTCEPADPELVAAAYRASGFDDRIRFVDGQKVQATPAWWFVAIKVEVDDPDYAEQSGINSENLMVFATDVPSGGTSWVPLGTRTDWNGTTPTGETIQQWRAYRVAARSCAGPG